MMRKILLCAVVGLIPSLALAAGAAGSTGTDTKADAVVKTETAVKPDAGKTVTAAKTNAAVKTNASVTHKVVHHRKAPKANTTNVKPATPSKPDSSKL